MSKKTGLATLLVAFSLVSACGGDETTHDLCAVENPPPSCRAPEVNQATEDLGAVDDEAEDAGFAADACQPSAEVCDGVDNDCDDAIDEDFPGLGEPCTSGSGACAVAGAFICNEAGDDVVCDAEPLEPSVELCDGIDNDCDDIVDNGFDVGAPCTVGVGECAAEGVNVCAEDQQTSLCDATAGEPTAEVCDLKDNDCDGTADEEALDATIYFLDCDGDGFAAGSDDMRKLCAAPEDTLAQTQCGTTSDSTWTTRLPATAMDIDCLDSDADVRPSQTAYFLDPITDIPANAELLAFDYDCDGDEDVVDPRIYQVSECTAGRLTTSIGTGKTCLPSATYDAETGWYQAVPACGSLGIFVDCEYTIEVDQFGQEYCEGAHHNTYRDALCH